MARLKLRPLICNVSATGKTTLPRNCVLCKNYHFSFECPPPLMAANPFGAPMEEEKRENSFKNEKRMFAQSSRHEKRRAPTHEVNNNSDVFKNRNVKESRRSRGAPPLHAPRFSHPPPLMPPMGRPPFSQHPIPSIACRPPPPPSRPLPPHSRLPPRPPTTRLPPTSRLLPPPARPVYPPLRGTRRLVNPGSSRSLGLEQKKVTMPCPIQMRIVTNALHPFVYGHEEDYEEVAMPKPKEQKAMTPTPLPRTEAMIIAPPKFSSDKMFVIKTRKCFDAQGKCTGIEKRYLEYTLGGPRDAIVFVDNSRDFDF